MMKNQAQYIRGFCRRAAGLDSRIDRTPVVIVMGDNVFCNFRQAPRVVGERTYYETRGGRPIAHPKAYAKKAWSNMVALGGDRRVEVGRGWLENQFPSRAGIRVSYLLDVYKIPASTLYREILPALDNIAQAAYERAVPHHRLDR